MTLEETLSLFKKAEVPEYIYAVNDLGDGECAGISNAGGVWTTFYSERGQRMNEEVHATEAAACDAFMAMVERTYQSYFGKPCLLTAWAP